MVVFHGINGERSRGPHPAHQCDVLPIVWIFMRFISPHPPDRQLVLDFTHLSGGEKIPKPGCDRRPTWLLASLSRSNFSLSSRTHTSTIDDMPLGSWARSTSTCGRIGRLGSRINVQMDLAGALTVLGCVDGRGSCGFLVLVLVALAMSQKNGLEHTRAHSRNFLLDSAADERPLEFGHHQFVQGG